MLVNNFFNHIFKLIMFKFSSESLTPLTDVDEYFKIKLVPLKDKFNKYSFAISGAISAGKSTTLQHLYNLFNKYNFKTVTIPEYIDVEPDLGPKLLSRYIDLSITNATFQNFILDTYRNTYNKIKDNDYHVSMLERVPDDSILIFANIMNRNHPEGLDEQTLYSLYGKMTRYNKLCDFPSYCDASTKFNQLISGNIEDVLINIIDIIYDDINSGVTKRIIGLTTDIITCISRIKRRGREEESAYSKEYLESIINAYNNIFKIRIMNNEMKAKINKDDPNYESKIEEINKIYNIRFTNIGRIIDPF